MDTPPKTNMETENGGPLEKEIPDLETIISRFHVNFLGCNFCFSMGDRFN